MTTSSFVPRHIGPRPDDVAEMLRTLGCHSVDELIQQTVPAALRTKKQYDLTAPLDEASLLERAREIAQRNQIFKNYIGRGYYPSITPSVIARNIFENPKWYTAYTPYQAEISQGRMEALLNFQTMVIDLTGLDIANSSLLDEATAAAEAMAMAHAASKKKTANTIWVAEDVFPQTLEVLQTRSEPLGIAVRVFKKPEELKLDDQAFAVFAQYPAASGRLFDLSELSARAHQAGCLMIVATDLLALLLLKPPGEMGADIAVGSTQRFGVPLGYGGPHAAFLACHTQFQRQLPGRIIGVSRDANGERALRLALQTREQHIRREKATSNICTAQVLLAVMASMYAVYHGPEGLRKIAITVSERAHALARALQQLGYRLTSETFFDTFQVQVPDADDLLGRAHSARLNFLKIDNTTLGLSIDETTTWEDLERLLSVFAFAAKKPSPALHVEPLAWPASLRRTTSYLQQPVFKSHHSETEMLRYIQSLESKDLSLAQSMIPLGSCTMKLNATTEMIPVSWPEFAQIHPFAPLSQAQGYAELIAELGRDLSELTGFAAVSLQPNAGSQGEYAGLLAIRGYHRSRGEAHRHICLVPSSAHGTNPASAVMAGMKVVVVACDDLGNIDIQDMRKKVDEHASTLSTLMVTYPSTHGVFEENLPEICRLVHAAGGQVYLDGANMNALLGLIRPAEVGADVCHMNLHKTFCIPHGGGGPGVGPIGVASHLVPFLPGHQFLGQKTDVPAVAAAPYGSAGILPISWAYVRMMGADGLRQATEIAILNANYLAQKLKDHFPLLYANAEGRVAHECILDLRGFRDSCGITVDDVAKRLMDYGFHAPTMSWPVAGTLMVEPTESESLQELNRFIEAMIAIRGEIRAIEEGRIARDDNPLKNAPHTSQTLAVETWTHPYSRAQAVFPLPWVSANKFWPTISRIDNAFGDRNLVCSCSVADYDTETSRTS
jgi:glycine dehydrogenase